MELVLPLLPLLREGLVSLRQRHWVWHSQCLLSSHTQAEMGVSGSRGQGSPIQAVIRVMPFRGSLPEKVWMGHSLQLRVYRAFGKWYQGQT